MRRFLILSLALAAPALSAPPNHAPRWAPAGTGEGGGVIEIDRASLTWRPLQHAWWRIHYAPPKQDGTVEERNLELIDCRERVSYGIETVSLDASGAVISDQRDSEDLAMQRMSPPTPGTPGETVAIQACRMRPPPPPPRKRP
ncbi:hypothetical protein ACFSCW_00915 [Sphingomonas tabacisoli]|uniref:Uncharacterized protein n=1 Tax=Sphingomonas tabacisoli TaxID=2249466 RepID=A0ABW4HYK0_9SPHN